MGCKKGCNLLIWPRPVSLHRYQRAGLLQCHHLCGNRHLIEDKSLVRLASDTPVGGDINENNLTLSKMVSYRIQVKDSPVDCPGARCIIQGGCLNHEAPAPIRNHIKDNVKQYRQNFKKQQAEKQVQQQRAEREKKAGGRKKRSRR